MSMMLNVNHQQSTNLPSQIIDKFFDITKIALTDREKQCLYYTLQGKSAKQIANMLGISYRTVETYLTKAKQKLEVRTKGELTFRLLNILMDSKQWGEI